MFSSFGAALDSIGSPRDNLRNEDDYMYRQAINLVHSLSQELASIDGIDVDLDIHWLPAVQNGPAIETAKECATEQKKDMYSLGIGQRAPSEMPQSISLMVEHWFSMKKPATSTSTTTSPKPSTLATPTFPGHYIPLVLKTMDDSEIAPVSLRIVPGTDHPLWWRDLGPAHLTAAASPHTITTAIDVSATIPVTKREGVDENLKGPEEGVVFAAESDEDDTFLTAMEEPIATPTQSPQTTPTQQPATINQHSPPDKVERAHRLQADEDDTFLTAMEEPMPTPTKSPQTTPTQPPATINQHSPPDKVERVHRLQAEIIALREDISKKEGLVDEKVQELFQLTGEHNLVWLASFSHEQPSFLRRYAR